MKAENLINEQVKHFAFGEGTVSGAEGNILTVRFENGKESKFSYPSCFYKFVEIVDDGLKGKIEKDVEKWLVDSGTLKQEQLNKKTMETQEEIKKREIERQKVRIEKAKAEAQRSRFFAGLDNPNAATEDE